MHVLIIEDDDDFCREIKNYLENSLYQVTVAAEFQSVLSLISDISPDIILLDLNLPGLSGFDLCTRIRRISEVPIIFVTGRADSMDEVTALLKGGDDYITKPFPPALLLAHMTAVLKRTGKSPLPGVLEYRQVVLDLAKGELRYQGQTAELTKNELKILGCLFLRKGTIVSRAELTEYLWDNSIFIEDNSLSIHITRIRSKLETLGISDFIKTRRGMGYYI